MHDHLDTIIALATPPGVGAIGVIRLSGPDAIAITDEVFVGKKLAGQPTHTLHFGRIMDGEVVLDEVVVSLFKAPKSYTGEEVVEISGHGSHYVLEQIIQVCIRGGARLARPGEFTQRAFLNGKLDLTQAEAVADLIGSQSGAAHRAAMYQLRGGFSAQLKDIREQLIQFSALIELELDFSQEDVAFADRTRLYQLIEEAETLTRHLVDSFRYGNVVKYGISVAIIGRPNAGKSTLLNALLNEERAIVSEIAGTTRDTIEEALNINGVIFRLMDTAGIREHSADVIESIGMARSHAAMKGADVVVYLFDVGSDLPEVMGEQSLLEAQGIRYLLVGNKTDAPGPEAAQRKFASLAGSVLFISALNKENIHQLKQSLFDLATEGQLQSEGALVTNARHHAALLEVQKSLQDIKAGMDGDLPGDLLALDIRRCLYYIGEITGEVTNEDKLDYIFSKFCIGK